MEYADPGATTLAEEYEFVGTMQILAMTDVGCKRKQNEDAVLAVISDDHARSLIAVADGMGGLEQGEVASSMMVAELDRAFRANELQTTDDLAALCARTDLEIARRINRGGTTVVTALADGELLHLVHSGDSRAYLLRDGLLRQLTSDHSWVQNEVDAGRLSASEARTHPRRNVLLQAIGTGHQDPVSTMTLRVLPGDLLCLASDGLHGVVPDANIQAQLAEEPNLHEIAQALILTARSNGGPDNISVVLCRIGVQREGE